MKCNSISNKNTDYSNIFVRPDISYEYRLKRRIIITEVNNKPCNWKFVFNFRTSDYKVRYFSIKVYNVMIDCNYELKFSDTEFANGKTISLSKNNHNHKTNPN